MSNNKLFGRHFDLFQKDFQSIIKLEIIIFFANHGFKLLKFSYIFSLTEQLFVTPLGICHPSLIELFLRLTKNSKAHNWPMAQLEISKIIHRHLKHLATKFLLLATIFNFLHFQNLNIDVGKKLIIII